jgi:hypothetical protein
MAASSAGAAYAPTLVLKYPFMSEHIDSRGNPIAGISGTRYLFHPKHVKAGRTSTFIVNNIVGLGRKSSGREWSSGQVAQ